MAVAPAAVYTFTAELVETFALNDAYPGGTIPPATMVNRVRLIWPVDLDVFEGWPTLEASGSCVAQNSLGGTSPPESAGTLRVYVGGTPLAGVPRFSQPDSGYNDAAEMVSSSSGTAVASVVVPWVSAPGLGTNLLPYDFAGTFSNPGGVQPLRFAIENAAIQDLQVRQLVLHVRAV